MMQHTGSLHLEKQELDRQFINVKEKLTNDIMGTESDAVRSTKNSYGIRHNKRMSMGDPPTIENFDSTDFIKNVLKECQVLR